MNPPAVLVAALAAAYKIPMADARAVALGQHEVVRMNNDLRRIRDRLRARADELRVTL